MTFLDSVADSFVYVVSLTGITGTGKAADSDVQRMIDRIRKHCSKPLAIGFGIKTPEQVERFSKMSEGVVVGSAILKVIQENPDGPARAVKAFVESLLISAKRCDVFSNPPSKRQKVSEPKKLGEPHFGDYGGSYIPETLVQCHRELEEAYEAAKKDPAFHAEIAEMRSQYLGGPTPLYHAKRLTEFCGGAEIYFKREELAHTGAHKINNAVGQAILARRLGKKRIIAETGAGQHGVATATVCALFGFECIIYMGAMDCERQSLNVFRMKMLGATVVPVECGGRGLKDAINEAMRDWVTNVSTTHYLIGTAVGPHPFPTLVKDFQSIIGKEARQQILDQYGRLPDAVVACVGGGSNAIGMFSPFVTDKDVKLYGVEAAGDGVTTARHSATLTLGKPGVLHGCKSYLIQNDDGQIIETHSISAGLDYPGVGPEHSFLKDSGRAKYIAVDDHQCMEGFKTLAKTEGILPALEPSHALYTTIQLAKEMGKGKCVLMNLCGRGDKDMHTVAKYMGVKLGYQI